MLMAWCFHFPEPLEFFENKDGGGCHPLLFPIHPWICSAKTEEYMLTFLFLAMAVKTYFPTLTINTVPTYIFLGFSCGPSKNGQEYKAGH